MKAFLLPLRMLNRNVLAKRGRGLHIQKWHKYTYVSQATLLKSCLFGRSGHFSIEEVVMFTLMMWINLVFSFLSYIMKNNPHLLFWNVVMWPVSWLVHQPVVGVTYCVICTFVCTEVIDRIIPLHLHIIYCPSCLWWYRMFFNTASGSVATHFVNNKQRRKELVMPMTMWTTVKTKQQNTEGICNVEMCCSASWMCQDKWTRKHAPAGY